MKYAAVDLSVISHEPVPFAYGRACLNPEVLVVIASQNFRTLHWPLQIQCASKRRSVLSLMKKWDFEK
jgi:hypothetical protein